MHVVRAASSTLLAALRSLDPEEGDVSLATVRRGPHHPAICPVPCVVAAGDAGPEGGGGVVNKWQNGGAHPGRALSFVKPRANFCARCGEGEVLCT